MIKKILISLTLITIIGCCWFFFTLFDAIDLAPTKNNHLASEEKWKIEQRADIVNRTSWSLFCKTWMTSIQKKRIFTIDKFYPYQ
ncbi:MULTISPECIES: hypothetical protein [Sphingobacterium]|uniref:hypothetical protein n=1 Tax=Sphingobacterium TaxID=28453 RepID=UPI00257C0664|nr:MULTISPECIES: hypothetical protein [Sphingobacterium]